ncbi:unnamed protein product [Spirodela intermedia]|uniref:Uncharacterized protein n=1 Tax=Spirodela intermedia TaxID=51605 RepID=A0A7I8K4W0_SPIIN|nr:unnamed protein product [Spirodela intermedia]
MPPFPEDDAISTAWSRSPFWLQAAIWVLRRPYKFPTHGCRSLR